MTQEGLEHQKSEPEKKHHGGNPIGNALKKVGL